MAESRTRAFSKLAKDVTATDAGAAYIFVADEL